MILLLSILVAFVPLTIGFLLIKILDDKNLSNSLFLFLFFASIWQFDVTVLYAKPYLSVEMIDFLFRLLRIGQIMLTPTLIYIAHVIAVRSGISVSPKWKFIIHKNTVALFYLWGIITYIVGWTDKGMKGLVFIESPQSADFYFPVYGSLSWVFHSNVIMFIIGIIACLLLTLRLNNNQFKSFLLYFIVSVSIGYGIGYLNIFPFTRLYTSGIAVVFFAFSVLTLSLRLHIHLVKKMNDELEIQKNFLQTVIDLNPNYIYAKNKNGVFTLVNKSFAHLHGITKEELIGKSTQSLSDLQHFSNEDKNDRQNSVTAIEEKITDVHGNRKWLNSFKIPIKTSNSTILLGVSTDITELKNQEEKIRYMAYHDDLTKLPNRRLFNEDLNKVIEKAKNNHEKVAVFFIDLDHFKYINDTLGHDVGDMLLYEMSVRLNSTIKSFAHKGIKVYRLGGDEFTVIFQDCEDSAVEDLANTILNSFKKPMIIEDHSLYITPSMGIGMFPIHGEDAITLMKNADSAMYFVKDSVKNNFKFYTPDVNRDFQRRLLIEKHLRTALEKNEFELHYQPQLDLQSGEISGMEALIRWNNKELGKISPAEFIPLAEETKLILPIGNWVMREACLQNKKWQEKGYSKLKMAVNISMKQFNVSDFVETVSNVLELTKLKPEFLELEITESIAMLDHEETINKLKSLKELGVLISIDDFGSGYSSLSYLQKYPIDVVKIDQSFMRQVPSNKENTSIVKSILSIAQSLKVDVVAEGVETETELNFLLETSCKYAQGYHIGYPMPANEFEKEFLS